MQPYFFPYIGHFQLIKATDTWIVFDSPQYIRHGWINRNRILKPNGDDWQYINVPLNKHQREITIKDIEISDKEDWRSRLLGQLNHYKKKAPYYSSTLEIVSNSINIKTKSIVELNVNILKCICSYLDIDFNHKIYSQINLSHQTPTNAGEWALRISEALHAKSYLNPSSGKGIFDQTKFENSGIELLLLDSQISKYSQKNANFIPGLSIIDVLMFNSVIIVKEMLTKYDIKRI